MALLWSEGKKRRCLVFMAYNRFTRMSRYKSLPILKHTQCGDSFVYIYIILLFAFRSRSNQEAIIFIFNTLYIWSSSESKTDWLKCIQWAFCWTLNMTSLCNVTRAVGAVCFYCRSYEGRLLTVWMCRRKVIFHLASPLKAVHPLNFSRFVFCW